MLSENSISKVHYTHVLPGHASLTTGGGLHHLAKDSGLQIIRDGFIPTKSPGQSPNLLAVVVLAPDRQILETDIRLHPYDLELQTDQETLTIFLYKEQLK